MKEKKHPLDVANSSGFLFQMGLEHHINSTFEDVQPRTLVLASEYPWRNTQGESGFIDLVVQRNNHMFLIEAKRLRDATWVFPIESQQSKNSDITDGRGLVVVGTGPASDPASPGLAVRNLIVRPGLPLARYCAVHGASGSDRRSLERVVSPLLAALEATAPEFAAGTPQGPYSVWLYLVPVVVTTAKLVICRFDPGDVNLGEGQLAAGAAALEEVGMVAFHKPFEHDVRTDSDWIPDRVADRERTVVVVNADAIAKFFEEFVLESRG